MPVPERESPTFAKARSQEGLGHLARSMLGRPSPELLSLEEVQERLRAFEKAGDVVLGGADESTHELWKESLSLAAIGPCVEIEGIH